MLDGGNAFGVIGQMVGAVRQLIDEGGPFVFWIFACGVVLWTLVLERWWFFMRILPQLSRDAQLNGRRAPIAVRGARARFGKP